MGKHVLYGSITATAKQPYIKETHAYYNDMIAEATRSICGSITGNNNTNYFRMYGAENTGVMPASIISAGAIYYNGEIYLSDTFSTASVTNQVWGTIVTTYSSSDPVLFSDGTLNNVHQNKKIVWADATSGDFLFSALQTFGSNSFVPAGAIMDWIAINPPAGYLVCDGSEVSKTTYANLFNLVGTAFGTAVNPLNFVLPDLKRRVRIGRDASYLATIGYTGGQEFVTLSEGETPIRTHNHTATFTGNALPSHSHSYNYTDQFGTNEGLEDGVGSNSIQQTGGTSAGTPSGTVTVANNTPAISVQGHNNMQPFMVVQTIIKY